MSTEVVDLSPIPNSSGGWRSGIFTVPHGSPDFKFFPFLEGRKRCLIQTDVIFDKYDPKTPNPYPIHTGPPSLSKYHRGYRSSTWPVDFIDSFKSYLEESRQNANFVPTTIDKDTFVDDVWATIFQYLSVEAIIDLQQVSKGFQDLVTSKDRFWRSKLPELCLNHEDLSFGPCMTGWMKFKALGYARSPKNEIGMVLDIGSSTTKYLHLMGSRGPNLLPRVELVTCDSLIEVEQIKQIVLGIGSTLSKDNPEQICEIWNEFTPYPVRCVLLLNPRETAPDVLPLQKEQNHSYPWIWMQRHLEISVAALCGYQRRSGVVISLGHSKSWIQVVKRYEPIWDCVIEKQIDIKSELTILLHALFDEVTSDKYEFCCIGAPFDHAAIGVFMKILVEEKEKKNWSGEFEIMSKVEERNYIPLKGAFLAPYRNSDFSSHLLGKYQDFQSFLNQKCSLVPEGSGTESSFRLPISDSWTFCSHHGAHRCPCFSVFDPFLILI